MIDLNSIDVLNKYLENDTSIDNIHIMEFKSYKLIQERIDLNGELNETFNSALYFREKYNLPFWDGFNLNLFGKKLSDFDFLDNILFHNSSIKIENIKREDFSTILNSNFKEYTAFCSLVYVNNLPKHIPVLDFHIPVSLNNKIICENVLRHLGLKGYLLDSGKSYHFIGNITIDDSSLKNLLYKALLLTPIIDRAWISHQLIQGYCCVRISKKYDRLPQVVSIIE